MTPDSTRTEAAASTLRGARRADLGARIKARARTLRLRLEARQALVDAVRQANATLDPQQVAAWLVGRAGEWVPAPAWAVIAQDLGGRVAVLAERGVTPRLRPSVWAVANWVLRHETEFASANLARDGRIAGGASGSALAYPLFCRRRVVGALVGLDPRPSASTPALGPSVALVFQELLEAPAIALDNALALQRAEALSVTDDLTRLDNSRYLNLVLRRESKRASRSGRPLSLLFVDLDGFKRVNDTHGHMAGSRTLVEVAGVLRECARETDVVARFGGDEFSIVLPETDSDGAVLVARRIADRLRRSVFLTEEGLAVRLTASVGVATLPEAARLAEELIQAADAAMYQVKARGKDGIHVATA